MSSGPKRLWVNILTDFFCTPSQFFLIFSQKPGQWHYVFCISISTPLRIILSEYISASNCGIPIFVVIGTIVILWHHQNAVVFAILCDCNWECNLKVTCCKYHVVNVPRCRLSCDNIATRSCCCCLCSFLAYLLEVTFLNEFDIKGVKTKSMMLIELWQHQRVLLLFLSL